MSMSADNNMAEASMPPAPTPMPQRPTDAVPPGIEDRVWNTRYVAAESTTEPTTEPTTEVLAEAQSRVGAINQLRGHPLDPNPTAEQAENRTRQDPEVRANGKIAGLEKVMGEPCSETVKQVIRQMEQDADGFEEAVAWNYDGCANVPIQVLHRAMKEVAKLRETLVKEAVKSQTMSRRNRVEWERKVRRAEDAVVEQGGKVADGFKKSLEVEQVLEKEKAEWVREREWDFDELRYLLFQSEAKGRMYREQYNRMVKWQSANNSLWKDVEESARPVLNELEKEATRVKSMTDMIGDGSRPVARVMDELERRWKPDLSPRATEQKSAVQKQEKAAQKELRKMWQDMSLKGHVMDGSGEEEQSYSLDPLVVEKDAAGTEGGKAKQEYNDKKDEWFCAIGKIATLSNFNIATEELDRQDLAFLHEFDEGIRNTVGEIQKATTGLETGLHMWATQSRLEIISELAKNTTNASDKKKMEGLQQRLIVLEHAISEKNDEIYHLQRKSEEGGGQTRLQDEWEMAKDNDIVDQPAHNVRSSFVDLYRKVIGARHDEDMHPIPAQMRPSPEEEKRCLFIGQFVIWRAQATEHLKYGRYKQAHDLIEELGVRLAKHYDNNSNNNKGGGGGGVGGVDINMMDEESVERVGLETSLEYLRALRLYKINRIRQAKMALNKVKPLVVSISNADGAEEVWGQRVKMLEKAIGISEAAQRDNNATERSGSGGVGRCGCLYSGKPLSVCSSHQMSDGKCCQRHLIYGSCDECRHGVTGEYEGGS